MPTLQGALVLSRVYLQVTSCLYYLEKTMVLKKFSCLTSTLCYLCFLLLLLWCFVTVLGRVCPLGLHNDTVTGLLVELLWELSGRMSRGGTVLTDYYSLPVLKYLLQRARRKTKPTTPCTLKGVVGDLGFPRPFQESAWANYSHNGKEETPSLAARYPAELSRAAQ